MSLGWISIVLIIIIILLINVRCLEMNEEVFYMLLHFFIGMVISNLVILQNSDRTLFVYICVRKINPREESIGIMKNRCKNFVPAKDLEGFEK